MLQSAGSIILVETTKRFEQAKKMQNDSLFVLKYDAKIENNLQQSISEASPTICNQYAMQIYRQKAA